MLSQPSPTKQRTPRAAPSSRPVILCRARRVVFWEPKLAGELVFAVCFCAREKKRRVKERGKFFDHRESFVTPTCTRDVVTSTCTKPLQFAVLALCKMTVYARAPLRPAPGNGGTARAARTSPSLPALRGTLPPCRVCARCHRASPRNPTTCTTCRGLHATALGRFISCRSRWRAGGEQVGSRWAPMTGVR